MGGFKNEGSEREKLVMMFLLFRFVGRIGQLPPSLSRHIFRPFRVSFGMSFYCFSLVSGAFSFYQTPLLPGLFFTATCVICDDVTSTREAADVSVRYARGSHCRFIWNILDD